MTIYDEAERAAAAAFGRVPREPEPLAPGEYVNAFGRLVHEEQATGGRVNAFGRLVSEVAPTPAAESVTEEVARLVRELEDLAPTRLGLSARGARIYAEAAGAHVTRAREGSAWEAELRILRARTTALRESLPLGNRR